MVVVVVAALVVVRNAYLVARVALAVPVYLAPEAPQEGDPVVFCVCVAEVHRETHILRPWAAQPLEEFVELHVYEAMEEDPVGAQLRRQRLST